MKQCKDHRKLNEKTVISALVHTAEKLKVENSEISVGINRLYNFGRWLREEKDIWYFVDFAPTFEMAYSLIEEYKIYLLTILKGDVYVKHNIESICNATNAYAEENNLFDGQRFEYKK